MSASTIHGTKYSASHAQPGSGNVTTLSTSGYTHAGHHRSATAAATISPDLSTFMASESTSLEAPHG